MTSIRKTKKKLKKQLVSKRQKAYERDISIHTTITICGESLRGILA